MLFVRQADVQHAPPPAYSSTVPTGLRVASEPRRGDGMNRQAVECNETPADKNNNSDFSPVGAAGKNHAIVQHNSKKRIFARTIYQ